MYTEKGQRAIAGIFDIFLLSRHDVRRDDEKFSSRRFERADDC